MAVLVRGEIWVLRVVWWSWKGENVCQCAYRRQRSMSATVPRTVSRALYRSFLRALRAHEGEPLVVLDGVSVSMWGA
jgi:hypothetical protein